mgnify:CR=1 FL=1
MRSAVFVLLLALAACVTPAPPPVQHVTHLAAADAATTLIVGQSIDMITQDPIASAAGEDPLVLMSLRHADGRTMAFNENNHAPDHLRAQAAGGPLAQIMGLFGDEAPKLYGARSEENHGAPFICGPQGPASIGFYEGADGAVKMVGLKQEIEFETLRDGSQAALPYSPDLVCARLTFRRS